MRIYPDWEPQIVTLSGNLPDGTITSISYYYVNDKNLYPTKTIDLNSAKRYGSTHMRCSCGEIYEKDHYNSCKKCRDKIDRDEYRALPVVDISYPCFVNNKLCFEQADIEDYIIDEDITDPSILEIHPAKRSVYSLSALDHFKDWCSYNIDEDSDTLLSKSDMAKLEVLSTDIENVVNNALNYYEADPKHRIIYELN